MPELLNLTVFHLEPVAELEGILGSVRIIAHQINRLGQGEEVFGEVLV